jgi:predicted PurR-regulated permease PerM
MNGNRFVVALFGILVATVIGVLAFEFIAPLTISVFLYYSTRRYHHALSRFRLPANVRAAIVMASLAVPLILLISYATVLLAIEAQQFIEQYALIDVASQNFEWFAGINDIPEFSIQGLYEAYQAGDLAPFVEFATEHAAFLTTLISNFFLNLFVLVIVTYYLLIDGHRISEWLLQFDDGAIIREYLEAVDRELEAVLFGNLLNVLAIALIAIGSFSAYNTFVPAAAEVPYPALAGALTGIASLVPVVGMKIIYVPLTIATALPIVLNGDPANLLFVAGFFAVAVVVVDTIPDLVLRPLLSGEDTHVGMLMLAYTLGPVVLGFYGLFLAPMLLVVGLTFANTALPRLLEDSSTGRGAAPTTTQSELSEAGTPDETDDSAGLDEQPAG